MEFEVMCQDDFKYDVAFSFLQEDEEIAIEINDLIQERLTTFIYSKQQNKIAGTDGEKTFNEVFGKDARIVVVLYRDGWGSTAWTRIEETAIRNRAFEDGYDFTVFLKLDKQSTMPKWLPKNRIWVGFDRWGLNGAAVVIEDRVQEAGGTPREETVEERVKRINREINAAEKRKDFLESMKGVQSANQEIEKLFTELEHLAHKLAIQENGIIFNVERSNRCGEFALISHGMKLFFEWILQISNSLEGSILYIQLLESGRSFGRVRKDAYGEESTIAQEEKFNFDITHSEELGWRNTELPERFFSTKDLADFCMKIFLDRIEKIRIK